MGAKRDGITKRRTQVAELVLSRATQRQIAAQLGVGVAAINRDIQAIRTEWRDERLRDADAHISEEIARLTVAEKAIWSDVIAGRLSAIDRLLAIMDCRARLLGLDAATNHTRELTIRVQYEDGGQPVVPDAAKRKSTCTASLPN